MDSAVSKAEGVFPVNDEKMELLRINLNKMVIDGQTSREELLLASRELDELILRSIKMKKYSKAVLGAGSMKDFEVIIDKLQVFERLYDSIRVVEPISKKVFKIKEDEILDSGIPCFDYWDRKSMCENCVSMRAYNEDNTIFKIERKGGRLYLITAVPISIQGKKLVAELLKDVTDSIQIGTESEEEEIKISAMVDNLNRAAVVDGLTNLYNRRYINEKLPADLLGSCLKNEPMSVIFADLDCFKTVNDTFGHLAGDKVLRDFAAELKKHVRKDKDWAARYGGDEFIICLSNTDIETAKNIAERIRKNTMKKEFRIGDNSIHVTCSFGVHTVEREEKCMSVEEIIEIVDKKLYKAKNGGRNSIV